MSVGTKNSTFGLVFGYDVGSDRSYLGEPTTNLIPDAANNGRFTTSNSWATYNTNQYCGNNGCGTYWTIPSISSVSSNIVTTSSAHQIRSFDVIQPNATGGGVNNGQNYVAKKISDTQFCLYPYNGSQSGADGYINPTTGFYKVHDDYANDNKVSISASGFPTGWWGAPHLPNAGLIKEIVPNGGRIPGTNCMRWHVYRGDGVADGMAYGVYTPVTAGDTITVSYYLRAATKSAVGKGGYYTTYFYGYGAFSAGFSWGAQGQWVRNVHQWTASYTSSFYQYWFPDGNADPYSVDIADLQVEVNRGHATKFTTSSRTATTSLLDMVRISTLDLSSMSYNSSGLPTFDGSNDTISVAHNSTNSITGDITIECVAKRNSGQGVLVHKDNQYTILIYSDGAVTYADSSVWSYSSFGGHGSAFTTGVYHHIVARKTGGTVSIYIDNVLIISKSFGSSISSTSNTLYIGSYAGGSNFWNGDIPVTKLYNRALTTSEISSHYYSYKDRFSLP